MIKKRCLLTMGLTAFLFAACAPSRLVLKSAKATPKGAPDLSRIEEGWVKVKENDFGSEYVNQLRREVVAPIRTMQSDSGVRWYAFLVHECPKSLYAGPPDNPACFHVWLERPSGMNKDRFTSRMSKYFSNVADSGLADIAGVDKAALKNNDWAFAWRMIGECSSWVFELLETHDNNAITTAELIQFMHYVTNELLLGGQFSFPSAHITF